jgi:phosphatidate cytidylyltransferase
LIASHSSPEHTSGDSKPVSELQRRVLSALVLAGLALSSDWYGGLVFAVLWGIASIAVLREWNLVIGLSGRALWASFAIGLLGIVIAIFLVLKTGVAPLIGFIPPMLAGGFIAMFIKRPGVTPLWLFFGPLYSAAIVVGPLAIRDRGSEGLLIIVWLFFVVWISDIGAFFVGRCLGGPKLWPSVSPKKTWSGFLGGLFFGTLVPVVTVYAAKTVLSVTWIDGWLLIGITLSTALVAECGDLFESAMKRRFHIKDTGTLIPGHGGLMDRLDSYTAAAFYLVVITGILAI